MAVKVGERVRAFDDGGALGVGTDLGTEVLKHGALWHSQGARHILQIRNVRLDTVEATLLSEPHLGHLVPAQQASEDGVMVSGLRGKKRCEGHCTYR